MEICRTCNRPNGGRTFGDEKYEYLRLLRNIWNQASGDTLLNKLTEEDNPYDQDKDVAEWIAWNGGFYYAKFRLCENPTKVEKWIESANLTGEDSC